jgi:UDP-glucose 4-epimerase
VDVSAARRDNRTVLAAIQGSRFAVFGGCGFVGSNIVAKLLALGVERCVAVDNLFTGDPANLPSDPRLTFVQGSVTDPDLLDRVLPGVDYVINCAAVNIMAAQEQPLLDLEVNAKGPLLLLAAMARHRNVRKLVYTSTASVYGNPEYLPIVEGAPVRPMSNYSVSKLAGEHYMMVGYLIDDLPTVVVRYSNVYGPNQSPKNPYCGVIGKFFKSAIEDGVVRIHGSGQQTRDFTYVDDAVEATLLATISPRAEGSVFNIATGVEVTVQGLAERIFRLLDKPPRFELIDKRDIDNISRRCLNIEHVRMRLKWEPRYGIDEGLRRTLEWFRAFGIKC